MSNVSLTEGILAKIMQGGQVENPVVQILCCKKIQGSDGGNDRYRLLLSDGKFKISFAMLASQINHQVGAGQVSSNTIIRIKRYITSNIQTANKNENRRVLVILDLDILVRGEDVGIVIGNPKNLTPEEIAAVETSTTTTSSSSTTDANKSANSTSTNKFLGNTSANTSATAATNGNTTFTPQMCHPIESISPYNPKWVLKARVMNKGPIRTWSNSKGEGKLFSMDLCDETGEIRATAFRDECDRFYDMIQVDKVYYISGGQVKLANKQFSNLKNDYEITLNRDTQIAECHEEVNSVPTLTFKFTPIADIANLDANTPVDVIGVCKETSDLMNFQSRAGRALKKREITLVDQSNASINLTLWGSEAEEFDGSTKPIIAIKGGRLSDFMGGKSISNGAGSAMRINPDIPEAHKLRGWFDNQTGDLETTNLSIRTGSMGSENAPLMTFEEIKNKQLSAADKLDFSVLGTIMLIKADNCVYMSCPQEQCNKKVIDMNDNTYRCEKCGRTYDSFKYRLLMNVNIADYTGSVWATVFSNDAEKMLEKTSQEMGEWLRDDRKMATEYIAKKNFAQYLFKCRSKMETFNDEARMRTMVLSADTVNYSNVHKHLSERISALTGVQEMSY